VDSLKVVRVFYTTLRSANTLAVLDLLAPSIRWTEMFPKYASTCVGPDAVRHDVSEPLNRDWTDFLVTPESFVVEDRTVVAFGTYSLPIKDTGKCMSVPFVHKCEVIDGKSTGFRQYADTALVQALLT
jgi:ketosteroid isomerase-like protein